MDERAMDFLSRPPVAKQGIKQVICHGHKAAVIFAGYSWDNSNLVTVDALGQISLWSCSQAKRSSSKKTLPLNARTNEKHVRSLQCRYVQNMLNNAARQPKGRVAFKL